MGSRQPSSTSSSSVVRRGAQEPRRRFAEGEVAATNGDLCAELGESLGLTLFPWQRRVVDDWLAVDEGGRPSYITCGLDVPRQNGKNACLEDYEMYRLAVDHWHILHTAHRVKTAKKAFQRLCRYFTDDAHPEMQALVKQIRRTNGEEAILLNNGGSIEFIARTNGSARGFDDIQLVVYDEAQELTDSQYDAITYTLAASSTGERQTLYMGTPPNSTSPGTVFARQRDAALAETGRKVCWSSWAAPDLPRRDATFDDVLEDVYLSNPSMGYVLDIDYTMSEFAGADIVGFAHERLDWWSPVASESAAIPRKMWRETTIDAIGNDYPAKTAFAVKFSADGSRYALAGAKRKRGRHGAVAFELIETGGTEGGTRALAEWLRERASKAACVYVDGLGGSDALCGHLVDLKAPRGYVKRTGARDVVAAATGLMDGLKEGTVAHTPSDELDEAARRSVRRLVGHRGGWTFGSPPSADVSVSEPLEAAALAVLAVKESKRNPRRKQRML